MSPVGRRARYPVLAASTPTLPHDRLRPLIDEHLGRGAPTGWFEPAYRAAVDAGARLPWQEAAPHPWVASWLDAPVLTPPGPRALVVGCGTGQEAELLAARGYAVVGIDVAPTALAWAAARLRRASKRIRRAVAYREADLLTLDPGALGPFDLVVEVHTVPWLPGLVQDAAMAAIGPLVRAGGVALTITTLRAAEDDAPVGPPWPQAPSALASYRAGGLVRLALEHPPGGAPGPVEVRLTWQRPRTGPVEDRAVSPGA
ncbi:MAG: class I SAM-dependent methyltransferase [Nitriliruptoraceae bacterium]